MSMPNDLNKQAKKECCTKGAGYQAYQILHLGFSVLPILAGLDKFANLLTNWTQYIAPAFNLLGSAQSTMLAVGIIEIIAGIGVFFKPKIFSYVVALWLIGIIVNLLLLGNFYDVALRDLSLALGALALGRLSAKYCSC